MNAWFAENSGLRELYREGVAECRAILERLATTTARTWTSAGAYYRRGPARRAPSATSAARSSSAIRCPGLAYNYLACIAKARGDLDGMMDHFTDGGEARSPAFRAHPAT